MRNAIFVSAILCLTLATESQGQIHKYEIMGSLSWSISEGISIDGQSVDLPSGTEQFNALDLSDGLTYGAGFGYFFDDNIELAFLWDYQQSELVAQGTTDMKIVDVGMDNFHGAFIFNFGGPRDRVRPILYGGLGATHFRSVEFTGLNGEDRKLDGESRFSTTWGAGAKFELSRRLALQLDVKWTPTYVKSDPAGYWCDPYWGCGTVSDPDYVNQFKLGGSLNARF